LKCSKDSDWIDEGAGSAKGKKKRERSRISGRVFSLLSRRPLAPSTLAPSTLAHFPPLPKTKNQIPNQLLLDLYEADAWGATSGRPAVCSARRAVLSQADLALTGAKRVLLPGLARELGCLEDYLRAVAVAAWGDAPRGRASERRRGGGAGAGGPGRQRGCGRRE